MHASMKPFLSRPATKNLFSYRSPARVGIRSNIGARATTGVASRDKAVQVGAVQVGAVQVGAVQVGAVQVGTGQMSKGAPFQ
jgi:hypothetical protein